MASIAAVTVLSLIFLIFTGNCHGDLQVGFYKGKCNSTDVESTVTRVVIDKFKRDPTIAAALIRLHFHDCFVNGCDASILLDGSSSEKTAPPNLSVRGYDVIDAAKAALEQVCPGVVSCADIIAMATRDAVFLSKGGVYSVETGRRDGLESLASKVNLPSPRMTVSQSVAAFAKKGLNAQDMVLLLGGHTIGVAHCALFQDRLYNFQNTGKPDPTMDPNLVQVLKFRCPQNSTTNNSVNLDQNPLSSFIVDNSFYKQILLRRAILQIDQELAVDPITKAMVSAFAAANDFPTKFGEAMVKLGAVQILTDTQGEIRRSCRSVNAKPLEGLLL